MSPNNKEEETCSIDIGRGPFYRPKRCGRPIKGKLKDGTWACGIHLAVERKRDQNSEKWKEKWKKRDKFVVEIKSFAEEFNFTTLRHAGMEKERTVQIDFDELKEILKHAFE